MRHLFLILILILVPLARADLDPFTAEVEKAAAVVQPLMSDVSATLIKGDPSAATEKLLAAFKEPRTPAQSFVLGNILFENDPKRSYELHKEAIAGDPGNIWILWEWALQQHRAKDYAGALASYEKYDRSKPGQATCYALQADCLLQLDRIDDAAQAWKKSEQGRGSIEDMESMVCAVKRDPMPHLRRAELLDKVVKQKDARAAADLMTLDCQFPFDWWNVRSNEPLIKNDLPLISAAIKDDAMVRAIKAAADLSTAGADKPDAVKLIFIKSKLILNDNAPLPEHGGLLEIFFNRLLTSQAMTTEEFKKKFGTKLLKLSRKTNDPLIWNSALFAADVEKEQLLALEREAFKATHEVKFAVGVLMVKLQLDPKLPATDPDLVQALKDFPENGQVQRFAYELAKRDGKVTRDLLASCCKAEFTHFTSNVAFATVVNRPRANLLRAYFAELLK